MTNDRPPRCSIVIRSLNEEQHIGRLLSGILQQTIKDVEIIIVDSGSTDATVAIASRYPVKILHIAPEVFSFGRSLNAGCQAISGEFVVFASAHVYPTHKDWLERLLAPFSDPTTALVYGRQRGNATTRYSEHQIFAKWFPDVPPRHHDSPFCNNANAAIQRALWDQFPYDEMITGLEDIDWAKRVIESGYKIVYAPDANVIHVHDEAFRQIRNRYRREAIAMKHIFPHERFTFWEFLRLFSTNAFSDLRHARHDGALCQSWLGILRFRLSQFWGTYRGYAQRTQITDGLRRTFYYPKTFDRGQNTSPEVESTRRIDYADHAEDE